MKRLAAAAAVLALLAPAAASAATPAAVFGLRPLGHPKLGYFVYHLAPGATTRGALLVTNTGNARGTVRIYAADASTGRTTGTIYLTDSKPKASGAWLHVAPARLTLAPHTAKRVAFTVHVPAHQRPGQWVAGVVAESTVPTSARKPGSKAGLQINVRNQTIIAVQVDVPGRLAPGFSVGGVSTGGQNGYQDLIVHVANTGNALAKPTGTVTVSKAGATVASLPFKMDTFLPQTAVDYPLLLKKALAAGTYTTAVTLRYAGAGGSKTVHVTRPLQISQSDVAQVFTSAAPTQKPPTAAATSGSSSTPWALIGGIAAAAVLLALLVLVLLRRRRRPGRSAPEATAPIEPAAPHAPVAEPSAIAELAPRAEPEPAPAAPQQPAPAPAPPADHLHYWQVAYDRGKLGGDGVWRFPHRCRECGAEVLAENIEDASTQAASAAG